MAGMARRQFLKAAGIGVGATALTCAGLGYLAARPPAVDVDFYENAGAQKESSMERILIAYASKLGSTGEVARALAEELAARGHAVDVKRVGEVSDVSAYGSVVLGSAVRRGRWLPEALEFLEQHAGGMESKSVAYFTVCMTMLEDTPANREKAQAITAAARAALQPAAEEFFGGRMEYGKVSLAEQLILRAMKVPEGDYRNWDAIRAWGKQLPVR